MPKLKLKRWAYVVAVVAASALAGYAFETRLPMAVLFALSLPVLTFPLGIIGALVVWPLIYFGIATPAEAQFVATPFFVAAGVLQWFYLLPRVSGSNRPVNPDAPTRAGY
ncbi:hypothetical protein [Massilia sp. TS11]|uniref:hypothetical protein n=1 Tax=Massilia sp. TS11 TaxID=2908003 RepID=UPI001EDABB29|nr:hypothetical protein [Massilia sp. TS11]MCG2584170.1 hypothetical protein [Massilia sp. TS11]